VVEEGGATKRLKNSIGENIKENKNINGRSKLKNNQEFPMYEEKARCKSAVESAAREESIRACATSEPGRENTGWKER